MPRREELRALACSQACQPNGRRNFDENAQGNHVVELWARAEYAPSRMMTGAGARRAACSDMAYVPSGRGPGAKSNGCHAAGRWANNGSSAHRRMRRQSMQSRARSTAVRASQPASVISAAKKSSVGITVAGKRAESAAAAVDLPTPLRPSSTTTTGGSRSASLVNCDVRYAGTTSAPRSSRRNSGAKSAPFGRAGEVRTEIDFPLGPITEREPKPMAASILRAANVSLA